VDYKGWRTKGFWTLLLITRGDEQGVLGRCY
jgi:hypothetical protein